MILLMEGGEGFIYTSSLYANYTLALSLVAPPIPFWMIIIIPTLATFPFMDEVRKLPVIEIYEISIPY